MSGPWAKYQQQGAPSQPTAPDAGPWTKYQQPQEAGVLSRVGNAIKGAAGYVSDLATGNDRTEFENVPELANIATPGNTGRLSAGMLLSVTPEQRRDVVLANIPGARVDPDKYGNDIVTLPDGRQAYLNKPGFSTQDAAQLATFAIPFMKVGQVVRAEPFLTRAAAQGATGFVTSIAGDLGARAAGSEQGVSLPRAALSASVSAAAEAVSPLLSAIKNRLTGPRPLPANMPPEQMASAIRERLPQNVKDAAAAEGVDIASAPLDLLKKLDELVTDAVNPEDATRAAQAQSLPVPVQLTRGQASGAPGQQMTEDMLRKDVYGQIAGARLRDFDSQQAAQLRANAPAIQQRLAGESGARVLERNQGGSAVQAALTQSRDALRQTVDDAYKSARSSTAAIPGNLFQEGLFNIKNAVAEGHTVQGLPRTEVMLRTLDDMLPKGQDAAGSSVFLRNIFSFRQRLNAAISGSSGEDQSALRALKNGLDNFIGDVAPQIEGDADNVNLWLQANAARRELGNRFQGGDLIEALTESTYKGGQRVLAVDPEQAGDAIFGKGRLPNWTAISPRDLNRLRSELGPTSDAWNSLREEAFLRLVQSADGALSGAERQFSGANLKNAWDQFSRQAPAVQRMIFSESERELIARYANVAARATNPVRGGSNFSNTAVAHANIITKIAQALGFNRVMAALSHTPIVGDIAKETVGMGRFATASNPVARSTTSAGAVVGPVVTTQQ